MDPSELTQIAKSLKALSSQKTQGKPTNDDELHAWIIEATGINLPRVAVCPGHNAPFDVIADLFFERVQAAILMANRGGGKTMGAALWNFSNCYWNDEIECISVGSQQIQAQRAYTHLKNFNGIAKRRLGDNKVEESFAKMTTYVTGAQYEILTGSKGSVNGPHPQRVHRDEVELMDKEVFQESLQMEKSKRNSRGELMKAQTLITSTRKTSDGLMQELLDECKLAEQEGRKPPYKVYIFCIKDIAERQDNCRVAYPDLPEEEKCDCHKVRKGEWNEGTPRTLDTVCDGAFAKADGFVPLEDIENTFMKSSKAMWEAQQECKRPYVEEITLEKFSEERCGVRNFIPDPANGPIFRGIDFGGTSPHACMWIQYTMYELEALNWKKEPMRIPEGSLIAFDEIHLGDAGNIEFADAILERDSYYRSFLDEFYVAGTFADPQASAARKDFAKHNLTLQCTWPVITRDREEHMKRLRTDIENRLFYVDIINCPMFVEQVQAWNIENKGKKKKFDHSVDATLYGVSNIHTVLELNEGTELPGVRANKELFVPGGDMNEQLPAVSTDHKHSELKKSDQWRLEFA